jgi:hypothetical protein
MGDIQISKEISQGHPVELLQPLSNYHKHK